MVETKEPAIITPLDNTRGCSKSEINCGVCIAGFVVGTVLGLVVFFGLYI